MLNPKNLKPGQEQYEEYYCAPVKKNLVQYDFRYQNGNLFSCVGKTLDECRKKRDNFQKI
ncbi:MAG TPA: hypothetical protein DHW82_09665 [Spirochaetia bacterium]|nr:MAG: hypothetical protein A2Y41_00490 [Spirochaetes bacterium GWB1_36_13]HCL57258.1 hypothetical protein [Spirochaetia bacterium]